MPFIVFEREKLKTKGLLHNCTVPVLTTYLFMVNKPIGGEIFAIWVFEKKSKIIF